VIQREFLEEKADAGLSPRLSTILLTGRSSGRSGSGIVGAEPGLVLRLSIRLCMRELLTRRSSGLNSGSVSGSEKGLSDAVLICGGGMMGIRDPVGLRGGSGDWKLSRPRCSSRLRCLRWRTKTTNPTITEAAKTTTRIDIPVIKDLETPVAAWSGAALDDGAGFAVLAAAEDDADADCCSTGSWIDVEDPGPAVGALLGADEDPVPALGGALLGAEVDRVALD